MNKYIYKLIKEQFNIGNMDLNNTKPKRNVNIFNKNLKTRCEDIYKDILNNKRVSDDDIEYMNSLVSVIVPKNKRELIKTIKYYSYNCSYNSSLNWLDVSNITNMSGLFKGIPFHCDISKWDVSNVKYMDEMFMQSRFDGNISDWDVSKVKDMSYMFYKTTFNNDISRWDVSNVTNMSCMFAYNNLFYQNISDWNVSKVKDMSYMFYNTNFDKDISKWNVSQV